MLRVILLLFASWAVEAGPTRGGGTCDYESCKQPKDGLLNVHIVAHTHDDVGWLKTVDQYYYGSNNTIQKAGVQYILDSVVKELWENPDRRFVYVETAFFWKWWTLQPTSVQSKVTTLVNEGRLKFAGGAWSMNDEATTYYQSTIDQFTWGLSKLRDTFGHCGRPRVGWQIDPFGHSREFASLLAGMGYDGLFLGRIDYQDKQNRERKKNMEMVWRGDDSLGKSSDIFTGVLYNTYSPPKGFCFDVLCNDEPIIDDPSSPDYNVDRRILDFLNIAKSMSEAYATNNLLVTMGEDFHYQDAAMWFKNLDKLIDCLMCFQIAAGVLRSRHRHVQGVQIEQCSRHHGRRFQLPGRWDVVQEFGQIDTISEFLEYVQTQRKSYRTDNVIVTMGGDFTYQQAGMWYENLDKLIQYGNLKAAKDGLNITLFYSTPDCYLKAVKDAHPTLPIKQDDFFPYASDPHAYWTGYFTSRPAVKYLEAETNAYLQVVKQLQVLGALPDTNMPVLNELKSVMGVLQHHDAVTGTEKQHVTRDYVRMVSQAVEDAHIITTQALNRNIFGDDATLQFAFDRCQFNESRCKTSEEATGNLIITIYNPLAWSVVSPVHIPIVDGEYEIRDGKGNTETVQIVDIQDAVLNIPSRVSKAKYEVTFIATLPPLGYKSYYMSKLPKRTTRDVKYEEINDIDEYFERIREKNYADVKNYGGEEFEDNNVVFLTNIPDEPKRSYNYNYINSDKRAKALLKTKKSSNDKNVEEFEKLFAETKSKPQRHRPDANPYPSMSDDEMRMLSDEPMVVERYDEMADEAHKKSDSDHNITLQVKNETQHLFFHYGYYPAYVGNNEVYENRSSGAYIFRPNTASPIELKKKGDIIVKAGPVYIERRITTDGNATFTLRDYKVPKINFHEMHFVVGPIGIDDNIGKEYIIKYQTTLTNNGEFYTDSNGRQMIKRKLNKRPQWNLTIDEPISGNYYPVVGGIRAEGVERGFLNVLPDRAVGAASLQEGAVEIMIHRRLLHDDAFGVSEALNETEYGKGLVIRGTHRVFFQVDNSVTFKDVLEMRLKPQVFVSDANGLDFESWAKLSNENSWLKAPLPDGVHLLTLEPFGHNEQPVLLIRLENYLDESESSSRVVDLAQLLTFTSFNSVQEMLLGANAGINEKWTWETVEAFSESFNKEYGSFASTPRAHDRPVKLDDGYKVNLDAKQIRTFLVMI